MEKKKKMKGDRPFRVYAGGEHPLRPRDFMFWTSDWSSAYYSAEQLASRRFIFVEVRDEHDVLISNWSHGENRDWMGPFSKGA